MTSLKLAAFAAAVAICGGALANDQTTPTNDQTKMSMPDFKSLDTNKDGVVSKDEAGTNSDLSAKFDALDADKDGNLSTSEYAKATGKDHSKSKSGSSGY